MGYMPRDRNEADALDMYRVLDIIGHSLAELDEIVGRGCRQHPDMKHSMGAVRDALADLESDAEGMLKRFDPDRRLENIDRYHRARELLARARAILPVAAE